MFQNLSLKTKIIIFFVLSIVSIYFIFNGEIKYKSSIEINKEIRTENKESKQDTYIKSMENNKDEKVKSNQ